MSIKDRQTLIAAMRLIVRASAKVSGEGLFSLFNAYNHLHYQLDGEKLPLPVNPRPVFIYHDRSQMIRTP